MPNNAPKTFAAYEAATLRLLERGERRRHLGASVLGDKCDRKIWYKFRWAFHGQQHEPRLLRLFRRGHREEAEFVRYLSAIPGVEVWEAGDAGPHKEHFRVTFADGHGGGTADGAISQLPDFPGEPALLEFKTFNDKQFQKLRVDGVMTAKWEYFVQMQIYMEGLGLPRALFMAVNKNDDEVYMEVVHCNSEVAGTATQRGHAIVHATEPPPRISDSPGFWQCSYCDFKKLCHFKDIPDINCRTCAYASIGPAGTWICDRGNASIATQEGCPEHVFDPRFFIDSDPPVQVLGADFERNEIHVFDGVTKDTWGPDATSSLRLQREGFIPF